MNFEQQWVEIRASIGTPFKGDVEEKHKRRKAMVTAVFAHPAAHIPSQHVLL